MFSLVNEAAHVYSRMPGRCKQSWRLIFLEFITAIGIPPAYSIADGLAIWFITYPFIKLISGKRKELRWPMVFISAVFLLYFIGVRERW